MIYGQVYDCDSVRNTVSKASVIVVINRSNLVLLADLIAARKWRKFGFNLENYSCVIGCQDFDDK